MANEHNDIFKSLRTCHLSPPKELFKKIWLALMNQGNAGMVSSSDAPKKQANDDDEYSDSTVEAFRALQDYSIVPPAFSTLKIDREIVAYPAKKTAKIIQFKYLARIAAAVLIISCALGISFSHFKANKQNETVAITATSKQVSPANNNSPVNSSSKTADQDTKNTNSKIKDPDTKKFNLIAGITKINHAPEIETSNNDTSGINTEPKLIDNDILLTLVSYHYSEYKPLLSEVEKDDKITLDQFSSISVSDKMDDILKKMYATKSNDKPTRKAKHLKAKVAKWNRADEKHFDAHTGNSPVDIIDLSEFIFK